MQCIEHDCRECRKNEEFAILWQDQRTKEGIMCRTRFISNGIIRRVISMTLFIFVSWTIAAAYTIVFYGGKQVQIPDNFIVTSDAVIYETAPGVNVSFRLNSIDVLATERANNEPSGSFLNHI